VSLIVTDDDGANSTPFSQPITVSAPSLGTLVGSLSLNCDRLFCVGNIAYVVSVANDSLYAINISNPASPSITGTLTDSTNLDGAFDVVVDGNYAYVVASVANRVTVVDVSNPASMTVAGSLSSLTFQTPTNIAKVGNYVFVTAINAGALVSLDVTTTTPSIADSVTGGLGTATSIEIVGNYAYIGSAASSSIGYVDISDPNNLGTAGGVSGSSNVTEAMVLLGNYLFTGGAGIVTNGIFAFDVSNPASPSFVSSAIDNTNYQGGRAIDAIGAQNVVLGCSAANKLQLFDVSNPASMVLVNTINNAFLNGVRDLQVHNGYIFTCSRASGSRFAAWSVV
jgi:hypothetical protein